MGIGAFTDRRDYCILCAVLMFLEDREEGNQFLLSELIRFVETVLVNVMDVDWTVFSQRRSLVRVMQYAQQMHMIRIYEGDTETFARQQDTEVLYENTGCSRYFAVPSSFLHTNTRHNPTGSTFTRLYSVTALLFWNRV